MSKFNHRHLARHGLRAIGQARLENRTTPAGQIGLISSADPSLYSDTAGGDSTLLPNCMSADGRFVVYTSEATNIVDGQMDENVAKDVFLHDRLLNTTALVSHSIAGQIVASDRQSQNPAISPNGRYVAFESWSTDLVADFVEQNGSSEYDVFLFDRLTGLVSLASRAFDSPSKGSNELSDSPIVSDNGIVAFRSMATNLVAGFSSVGLYDAYIFDVSSNQVTLMTHTFGSSNKGAGVSSIYRISDDGRYVAITSTTSSLLSEKVTPFKTNVYLFDRTLDAFTLVSHVPGSMVNGGDQNSAWPTMTPDASYIAYWSRATNLVTGYMGPANAGQVYLYERATGINTLVSHAAGAANMGTNAADTSSPIINNDGSYVAFHSSAGDLVTGFVDGNGSGFDCYFYDRSTGQNSLITHEVGNALGGSNGLGFARGMSNDGRYLVIESLATNLIAGFVDQNGTSGSSGSGYDIYWYDRLNGTMALAARSYGTSTVGGNRGCSFSQISGDGTVVVFQSRATDLLIPRSDENDTDDVFSFNTSAYTVTALSHRSKLMPADSAGGDSALRHGSSNGTVLSGGEQMSSDGRFVVFSSLATNLLPGQFDVNLSQDVFLHDRQLNLVTLISRRSGSPATSANGPSSWPVISDDGNIVVYQSLATDLVPGFIDNNGSTNADVFAFNRLTGATMLVSRNVDSAVGGGNLNSGNFSFGNTYEIAVSGDGRCIAFNSNATDLVAGFVDQNGATKNDLFLFDSVTGTNTLVSCAAGTNNKGGSDMIWLFPSISADGKYVAYSSHAFNIVPAMYQSGRNVFVFDRDTGTNTLVSHAFDSLTTTGNGGADDAGISADGKFIVYKSASNTIVAGTDPNNRNDIFLYERLSGVNTLVSHAIGSSNNAGDRSSDWPVLSADGRYVSYLSRATNLVSGFIDNNGFDDISDTSGSDVYLFDRLTGQNVLLSGAGGTAFVGANDENSMPAINGTGRFVVFASNANNLVAGVTYPFRVGNMFLADPLAHSLSAISRSWMSPQVLGLDSCFSPSINADGSVVVFGSDASNLVPGDYNGWSDVFWYSNAPAVQSVTIANGTAQRSVVRSVTIAFDQFIPFVSDPALAFEVKKVGAASSLQLAVSVSNNSNTTVTLTFSGLGTEFGSIADGKYQLTVRGGQWAGGISNLDGNNDGFAGDDYTFNFHRLFGDANGNGTVNTADFAAFRTAFGSSSFIFDFNNTGSVDTADFNAFRSRFGASV